MNRLDGVLVYLGIFQNLYPRISRSQNKIFMPRKKIDFDRKVINPKCAKTLMIKSMRKYPKVGRATICHKPRINEDNYIYRP